MSGEKVYVVYETNYENSDVKNVFSTKAAADAWIAAEERLNREFCAIVLGFVVDGEYFNCDNEEVLG